MIYTELTNKALNLMFEKHKDQVDKAGIPYVFHPFHLAEQMPDETSTLVALMHDLVEDTDVTFEDLSSMGFPEEVVEAIKLLTHDKSIDYLDYVEKISKNSLARKVKIADLEHNMDPSRLSEEQKNSPKRKAKYEMYVKSLELLKSMENQEP